MGEMKPQRWELRRDVARVVYDNPPSWRSLNRAAERIVSLDAFKRACERLERDAIESDPALAAAVDALRDSTSMLESLVRSEANAEGAINAQIKENQAALRRVDSEKNGEQHGS